MKQLIKVLSLAGLILFLAVGCNEFYQVLEDIMDFDYQATKDYTNTITQSVGPTTSTTSRVLVDTDISHYIYLDATTGDDADSGFTPALAKKTFSAAYGAISGIRRVIHIMDSSAYTNIAAIGFNTTGGHPYSGIQAELGQVPIIDAGNAGQIVFNDSAGGITFASGIIIVGTPQLFILEFLLTGASSSVVTDCMFYHKNNSTANLINKYLYRTLYVKGGGTTGTIQIKNNIINNQVGLHPVYIEGGTAGQGDIDINNNIVYNTTPLQSDKTDTDLTYLDFKPIYLGTVGGVLTLDFDETTLVATIGGSSTVAALTADAFIGYYVDINNADGGGSTGYFKVVSNTTTALVLQNIYGIAVTSVTDQTSNLRAGVTEAAIFLDATFLGTTVNVTRNILVGKGHRSAIYQQLRAATTNEVITAEGNVSLNYESAFVQNDYDITGGTAAGTLTANENILYTSLETSVRDQRGIEVSPTGSMAMTSTTYSNSIVPVYFNQQNALIPVTVSPYVNLDLGYVRSAYDFRLRQQGKKYFSTDTQVMIIDSPLLDLYITPAPDEDLNPWTETLTESAIAYAATMEIQDYPPRKLQVKYTPKNPIEVYDLHGNPKIDWDAWRKEFTFSFSSYTNNENIWRLYTLLEDKGVKKFYPVAKGTTMLPGSADGTLTGLTTTTASFVPDPLSVSFIEHHWKGFWITLPTTSGTADYYISDNTASTFSLIDKLGVGFPANGNMLYTVQYILVQSKPINLQFGQDNFTRFLVGGAWEEKGDTDEHEYTNTSITFIEAENPV